MSHLTIDNDLLISLEEKSPVSWYKTLDTCNNRDVTKKSVEGSLRGN